MKIQTVLPVHTQENPFVITSYPYGRLRCVRNVWLETKKGKGTRFMAMTQNPKTGRWNKPHASTYQKFSGALFLDENGHVQWQGVNEYTSLDDCKAFLATFGENCTDHDALATWTRKKEIFEEEMKRFPVYPEYGSESFQTAYKESVKRFVQENLK